MDLSLWGLVPMMLGGTVQPYDNPKALVAAIYAPAAQADEQPDIEQFYSARLKGLVAENLSRTVVDQKGQRIDPDAPPILDFNPFLDGNETVLNNLSIGEPTTMGDRAVATVTFVHDKQPALLSIAMVKEADGWHVDDVASLGAENQWLLSWLLQYDPFSEQ